MLVVVLDVPPNETMTENVFGILPNGETAWQIERDESLVTAYPGMDYVGVTDIPEDDKKIKCHHFAGFMMIIDVTSGKILDTIETK